MFEQIHASIRGKYGRMIPLVKRISRQQGRLKKDQTFGDTIVALSLHTAGADGDRN